MTKNKSFFLRLLSLALTVLTVAGAMPTTVFAVSADAKGQTAYVAPDADVLIDALDGKGTLIYYNSFDSAPVNSTSFNSGATTDGTTSDGVTAGLVYRYGTSKIIANPVGSGNAVSFAAQSGGNHLGNLTLYASDGEGLSAIRNKGKSFVFSADIKLGDTSYTGAVLTLRATYNDTNNNRIDVIPLFLKESELCYGAAYDANKVVATLSGDEFTNVAVQVNVAKNTYTVYIDGKAVASGMQFLNQSNLDLAKQYSGDEHGFAFQSLYFYANVASDASLFLLDNMTLYTSDTFVSNEAPAQTPEEKKENFFIAPNATDIRNAGNTVIYFNDFESDNDLFNWCETDTGVKGIVPNWGTNAGYSTVYSPYRTGKVLKLNSVTTTKSGTDENGNSVQVPFDMYNLAIYSTQNNTHLYVDNNTVGKSFVWSTDIMLGDDIVSGGLVVFRSTLSASPFVEVNTSPFYISANGILCYGGAYSPDRVLCTLSQNEFTNIALHVNSADNTYDVYINGEKKVEKYPFLTAAQLEKVNATDENGNYLYPHGGKGFGVSHIYISREINLKMSSAANPFYFDNMTVYLGDNYVKTNDNALYTYLSKKTVIEADDIELPIAQSYNASNDHWVPVFKAFTDGASSLEYANSIYSGATAAIWKSNKPPVVNNELSFTKTHAVSFFDAYTKSANHIANIFEKGLAGLDIAFSTEISFLPGGEAGDYRNLSIYTSAVAISANFLRVVVEDDGTYKLYSVASLGDKNLNYLCDITPSTYYSIDVLFDFGDSCTAYYVFVNGSCVNKNILLTDARVQTALTAQKNNGAIQPYGMTLGGFQTTGALAANARTLDFYFYDDDADGILTDSARGSGAKKIADISNHFDFESYGIGATVSDTENIPNSALALPGLGLDAQLKEGCGGIKIVDDGEGGKAAQFINASGERYIQISSVGAPATANSGKSFVFSVNLKKSGKIYDGYLIPLTARFTGISGYSDVNALVIFVDSEGKLYYSHKDGSVLVNEWDATNQKNASYGDASHCIGQLSEDRFTNVAIAVNVKANTFKVYIDGVAKTGDLKFLSDEIQALWAGSTAYPNGFGFAYSRMVPQNLIFDDVMLYFKDAPIISGEHLASTDGKLYLINSDGYVKNKVFPDGILETDQNGTVTLNGTPISSLSDVYTMLCGQVVPKNGIYSGLYVGNSLNGENGSAFYYDADKNLVVNKPEYEIGGKVYSVSERGECALADGAILTKDGAKYYADGVRITDVGYQGSYYVKDDGYLANGLVNIDGTYCFFKNFVKTSTISTSTYKAVNERTGAAYSDLATAINSAYSNDVITLIADLTVNGYLVMPDVKKVTVNLNGKTLTATGFTAFGPTNIIDTEIFNKGAIVTNAGMLVLPDPIESCYLPVKNEIADSSKMSYSFYYVKNQYKLTKDGNKFSLLFRPSLESNSAINAEILGVSAEGKGISITIDITVFRNGKDPYTKSFIFSDELLSTVYSGTSKALKASVTCKEKFEAVRVCYTVHSPIANVKFAENIISPEYDVDRVYAVNNGTTTAMMVDFNGNGAFDDNGYSGTSSYTTVRKDVNDVDLKNYSDYHTVKFKIYSAKKTNAMLNIKPLSKCTTFLGSIISSDETGYHTGIAVFLDFVGWKEFEMKVDALSVSYPLPKLSGIRIVQTAGDAGASYIISDFQLCREELEFIVGENVDVNSPALYDSILNQYRNHTIGSSLSEDLNAYWGRVAGLDSNCENAWNKFKDTYDAAVSARNGLFGVDLKLPTNGLASSYPYQGPDLIINIYTPIRQMAQAYACKDSVYYHNAELLADIKKALEYGYNNYYGTYLLTNSNGTGTSNWYGWRIGTPSELIPTLIYIEDALTEAEITKYLAPFDLLLPFPVGCGSNLINMAYYRILASALEHDYQSLATAMYFLDGIYPYVTMDQMWKGTDGGFLTDGSFIQHNHIPYHGSYGTSYISSLPTLMFMLRNSSFTTSDENILRQFEWVMESFDPIIYGNNFMATTQGRAIGAGEGYTYQSYVKGIIMMLPYAPESIREEFKSFVKGHMITIGGSLSTSVPIEFYHVAEELWNDDTVVPFVRNDYTKVYGNMLRVVQHGPKYGVCISLSSTRISKYESINGANETGWYHGDGMLYIYTHDVDYGSDFFYFANPYLMPGTTVNSAVRKRVNSTAQNKSNFAGGVEHGRFGASGFVLEYDWRRSSGTFNKQSDASIKAKKSYFMFDNEIVCIGSGISDASGTAVKTVVENRRWHTSNILYIDGQKVDVTAKTFEYYTNDNDTLVNPLANVASGARSMYFTNMGGYVFLGDNTVRYQKTTYNGHETQGTLANEDFLKYHSQGYLLSYSFLEITLDHGTNPNGDTYEYIYLPEATLEETNTYTANPDVKVLSKSDTVHAVLETKLGALGAVFYGAGTLNVADDNSPVTRIYANNGACVMISANERGETVISVSEPTCDLEAITLEIDVKGMSTIKDCSVGSIATIKNGTLKLNINTAGVGGKTFTVTVA